MLRHAICQYWQYLWSRSLENIQFLHVLTTFHTQRFSYSSSATVGHSQSQIAMELYIAPPTLGNLATIRPGRGLRRRLLRLSSSIKYVGRLKIRNENLYFIEWEFAGSIPHLALTPFPPPSPLISPREKRKIFHLNFFPITITWKRKVFLFI